MTAPVERLKQELDEAMHKMRRELTRVELLAAGLAAFSRPVPDYKPRFYHVSPEGGTLTRFELSS
jgi:hypothetical protein